MAADRSTLAAEYRASPHGNSNCTEHRLNIDPTDDLLSSEGPVETEEPAPAVRTHGDESTPAIAENVAATVPVLPATTPVSTVAAPTPVSTPVSTVAAPTPVSTPVSTVAAPTPMSTCETEFRNLMAFRGLAGTRENLCRVALEDWQSSAEFMSKKVEMRLKEIRSTKDQTYQVVLVGFYSAFQGLLLTAIAQSNLLHWNNRGYPLALSAFATAIVATGVVQKNMIISDWKGVLASASQH